MYLVRFASKNLLHRKVRSSATIIGIGLAVATMVALTGMSAGFEAAFEEMFERRQVDIVVLKGGSNQRLNSVIDEGVRERIEQIDGVQQVMAALVELTTLDPTSIMPDIVNGWPLDSPAFDELELVQGQLPRGNEQREVVLGALLAERLGKQVGDTIEVEVQPFEVVGIFESRNHYENSGLVMPLGALQELIDRKGKVTAFSLRLAPTADRAAAAARICKEVEQLTDADGERIGLDASTSDEFVATTNELHFAKGIAWMTSTVALLISAVGVLNTMMMSVFERTAELGVLRAIGWRRTRIVRLVLYESIVLSVIGAIVGSLVALLVVRVLSAMPAAASIVEGSVPPLVVAQGILLGVLIGSLGGLYPALRAATIVPAQAIHHI